MEIVIAIIVGVVIWYVLRAKKAASETNINPALSNTSYAYNIVDETSLFSSFLTVMSNMMELGRCVM